MKVFVVGCGAMGSIYAALLAAAGNDVAVLDANPRHIDAINARGLRVSGASGDRTVHVEAHLAPPSTTADLVICAVKARHVASAADAIQALVGPDTVVLTIQNGLGSADILGNQLGADRLMVGVAQGFGASLPEPGHAHHNDMKSIRMGAFAGLELSRVAEIAGMWAAAGFDAAAVEDILAMQWGKLICNVAYSAPCGITGMTVGEVRDHPRVGAVSRAAATEAYGVARKLGIELAFDDPVQEVRTFAARMPDAKPSVLLDIEAGRLSEVDVINGAVPVQAKKIGAAAPINAALTTLVQTLEAANA